MSHDGRVSATDRYLSYLKSERGARNMYRALAELTTGDRRDALRELADIEDKHAAHWVDLLEAAGASVPPDDDSLEPSDAELLQRARTLSLDAILPDLEQASATPKGCTTTNPTPSPAWLTTSGSMSRSCRR